jgi:predicted nuclease of predicted toxin-antitoxin system
LAGLGHDVLTLHRAGLEGAEDERVVEFAVSTNRVIVTLDVDFGRIYYMAERGRLGVIVVRIHPPTIERVERALGRFLKAFAPEGEDAWRCLVMLEESRYRLVRGSPGGQRHGTGPSAGRREGRPGAGRARHA